MASSPTIPNVDDVWLSTRVRVKKYVAMEKAQDRTGIAKFLYERFMERYVLPLRAIRPGDENGFLMAGACCLLIEGMTAFREGWRSTEGKSKEALKLFVQREAKFAPLLGHEKDFWKGVRCGILHQGETAKGWRLNFTDRNADLFQMAEKRVNCFKFLDEVEHALTEFRDELAKAPWNGPLWNNVRTKMAATIDDCRG